ncbi:hypothetical protein [Tortoise microvirus 21]|nr:hypothetical protein [Tortoise microvirus 21]
MTGYVRRLTTVELKEGDIPYYFSTHYDWMQREGEINCGETIVDPSGYIPAKNRIENLLRAGERLDAYRRELYDYGADDEDSGFYDPTRDPGFDPADASKINREAMARVRSAQEAASVKQDVEAQSEAPTASNSVSKEQPTDAKMNVPGAS